MFFFPFQVIVVHNRKAGETWLFDISLSGELGVEPVSPQATKIPIANADPTLAGEYPNQWVVFSPDIIIDANSGTMWRLKLKLNVVYPEEGMSPLELPRHISFLLQRQGIIDLTFLIFFLKKNF